MLIRSQNKKLLLNFNTVSRIRASDGNIEIIWNRENWERIGSYKSQNEAIQVLDMIQYHADNLRAVSLGGGNIYNIDETFQMPQCKEATS